MPQFASFVEPPPAASANPLPGCSAKSEHGPSSHGKSSSSSGHSQDELKIPVTFPLEQSNMLPARTMESTAARLSHVLAIKRSGLPSAGSVGHTDASCRPCQLDFRG